MPIFEVGCNSCGAILEELAPHDVDFSKSVCQECGNRGLQKLVSRFNSISREALMSSDICKPMTEKEATWAKKQKTILESRWREFKDGRGELHQGKFRDKSLDPDFKHAEAMGI